MSKKSKNNATPFIKSFFSESLMKNDITLSNFFIRLKLLALNTLKFENLPLTINERYMQEILFQNGSIIYFNDENIGNLALQYVATSPLDVYNEPLYRRAFAANEYHINLTKENSVIIYDNFLKVPLQEILWEFSLRLTEIQRAIDVNVKSQKFPIAILSTEEQRLSMKNIYQKYDGNEPVIFANKNLNIEDIKVVNTQSPYVADKLRMLLHDTWNEALTYLGIENANQDKKERLVADEVGSNSGNVEMQRNIRLDSIRQSLEIINIKFNQNIQVNFNSNLSSNVNKINLPVIESEGKENEQIYDTD